VYLQHAWTQLEGKDYTVLGPRPSWAIQNPPIRNLERIAEHRGLSAFTFTELFQEARKRGFQEDTAITKASLIAWLESHGDPP